METTRMRDNPNPIIFVKAPRAVSVSSGLPEVIDEHVIFETLRDIRDPEYPNSLEELAVVIKDHITVDTQEEQVRVDFTPTVPHCSMATLIGLCIRVKLLRVLPHRYNIDVYIREGAHVAEDAINKQLNDKERVAAAMENPHLIAVVEQCLGGTSEPDMEPVMGEC